VDQANGWRYPRLLWCSHDRRFPIIVGIWAEQRAASSEFTNLKLHTFIIEAFLVVLVESFHKDRVFAVDSRESHILLAISDVEIYSIQYEQDSRETSFWFLQYYIPVDHTVFESNRATV
jgi:hypothetical protein